LKQQWEEKERYLLQKDIDSQLKMLSEHTESPIQ